MGLNLERTEWRSRHESKPGRWPPPALRLPDDPAERRRRANPSEAMPVILTTPDEFDVWMRAVGSSGSVAATAAQTMLTIVASGERAAFRDGTGTTITSALMDRVQAVVSLTESRRP